MRKGRIKLAGHVQKRGKESWLLVYPMGYDANGKRIRKTKTVKAKNKTEAEKLLAAFITEIELGEYVAPSNIKFGDYVKLWRKEMIKKVAPQTLETYDYVLNHRILPAFAHQKMEDITHGRIKSFLESLEADGLASSTIQKHYNVLNSIFKLAVKNETIKKNPMEKVDKPSVTYKPGDVYTSSELRELFQLLNKEENRQMALMVKMALTTGMRKGELLALQWDDVDFSTNTIHVRHSLSYTKETGYQLKEPKTQGSIRKIAPPKKLMDELKRHKLIKSTERLQARGLWQGGEHFFVFSTDLGKPFFPDVPNKWWNRFLERTGFKKIRFHDLRHTAATELINKGANIHSISKRLGHADIKITSKIYAHYLEEADQKIAEMLNEDYI